ncbi:MAG: hypothetical protein ABIH35_01285 [Patescibacteria group bacterium]
MSNLERVRLSCGHNPKKNTQSITYTHSGDQDKVGSVTLQTLRCTKQGNAKNGGTCATLRTDSTFSEICGSIPNSPARISLKQTLEGLLILNNHDTGFVN